MLAAKTLADIIKKAHEVVTAYEIEELEAYLEEGWEFVSVLLSQRALIHRWVLGARGEQALAGVQHIAAHRRSTTPQKSWIFQTVHVLRCFRCLKRPWELIQGLASLRWVMVLEVSTVFAYLSCEPTVGFSVIARRSTVTRRFPLWYRSPVCLSM